MRKIKKVQIEEEHKFIIIKSNKKPYEDIPLIFTFANFNSSSISIDGFNNYYANEKDFTKKISVLFGKALPLLSKEKLSIFSDLNKMDQLHLHLIKGKEKILREILKEYQYNEQVIEEIVGGNDIYQFEVPYENGASRVVFQKIDNLISFLFLDPNHHIYLNRKFVDGNGSLFYEICPINEAGDCKRMDYFGTCFMFEFLDEEKYLQTFGFSYTQE